MAADRKTFREPLETKWTGSNAARYDQARRVSPEGKLFSVSRRRALVPIIDRLPPGKAIEMAAGTGLVTQFLLARGFLVTATDVSEDMLAQLKTRIADLGVGDRCEVRTENAFALSQDSAAFDLAVCIGLLTWINSGAELRRAFGEAARVLRPGGHFLFNYRNRWSPHNLYTKGRGYSSSAIRAMLAEAGLRPVATRNSSHFRLKFWRSHFGAGRILLVIDRMLDALKSPFPWHVYVLARKA